MIKQLYYTVVCRILYRIERERLNDNIRAQKAFFSSLPAAQDDYQRAYNRYLCKLKWFPWWYGLCMGVVSFFALPVCWAIFVLRGKRYAKTRAEAQTCDAIITQSAILPYDDIIPEELVKKYPRMLGIDVPSMQEMYIDEGAQAIIGKCLRQHPFSFFFNFTILYQLARYCVWIRKYKPKAIIRYAHEKQIEMPLVSLFCEQQGIESLAFMHGVCQYKLTQAYLRTTKFYVWDEHYIELFTGMGCPREQFVLYKPAKLSGICEPRKNPDDYSYYATYYLCNENKAALQKIAQEMTILRDSGRRCKIRPHPRASDMALVNEIFGGLEIEDTRTVSLADSLECTRYTIALTSTVLSQAYYSGKEIVLDDCTERESFELLEEKQNIMINKPHRLLSELLAEALQSGEEWGSGR